MLTPGQRVYHKKFGWGKLLSVRERPGTPMGDSAWVEWDTHTVSTPRAGRTNNQSNVNLSSLSASAGRGAGRKSEQP